MLDPRTRRFLVNCVAFLVIGAGLLACAIRDNPFNNTTSADTSSSHPAASGTTSTTAPTTQHASVGQQVKVGDTWIVIVNSARTSQGSPSFRPNSGNVYLLLTISTWNVSSQEQSISGTSNFSLQDNAGRIYEETIDPDAGATLGGKIGVGSSLSGSLVYEVPTSMHRFTLAFRTDGSSDGQTLWDIAV